MLSKKKKFEMTTHQTRRDRIMRWEKNYYFICRILGCFLEKKYNKGLKTHASLEEKNHTSFNFSNFYAK